MQHIAKTHCNLQPITSFLTVVRKEVIGCFKKDLIKKEETQFISVSLKSHS